MRLITLTTLATSLLLSGCFIKGTNPDDPFEPINRKTHRFNMAVDTVVLKPAATVYKTLLPSPIRAGINNAYNNVNMLPTIASDILQAEWNYAIKDSWRFFVNSTFGIGGILDAASKWSLPPHNTDLGLTFAKWGDKKSPYVVLPLLGPSTIRDGMGMMFEYALFTPYPYINNNAVLYSLLGVRYVDLRSQMFETDRLIAESLDQYAFIRDAYLQHRNYLINGQQQDNGALYVGDEANDSVLSTTPVKNKVPIFPLTSSPRNAPHSPS